MKRKFVKELVITLSEEETIWLHKVIANSAFKQACKDCQNDRDMQYKFEAILEWEV